MDLRELEDKPFLSQAERRRRAQLLEARRIREEPATEPEQDHDLQRMEDDGCPNTWEV